MPSSVINSDDGSVSGTTGLKTTGGDDGELAFESSGTEAMRIDSSGNVGIGTSSPVAQLNVVTTGNLSTIAIGDTAAGGYSQVLLYGGSGKYNWSLGAQFNINNAFEITPSTATDGTTFNTPAFAIDSSGNLRFNSGYGSAATAYGCRAWVNFNGTGTVAINGSGNVSSITDNGTGDYTVNFTNTMPDTNYSVVGACGATSSSTGSGNYSLGVPGSSSIYTTTQVKVQTWSTANSIADNYFVNVAIFR